MDIGDIAALVVSCGACLGLIATWIKNGRSQSEERGALKTDIENLQKEVEHPEHGLSSIKKAVDEQKLHCATISTGLTVRMEQVERQADDGGQGRARRKKT